MPELPEVQSVVDNLDRHLAGCTINSAAVFWKPTIDRPRLGAFKKSIVSRQIRKVSRRGKFIIFSLIPVHRNPSFLLVHLRMSGKLMIGEALPKGKPGHVRAQFRLSNGNVLYFQDVRKFGRIYLVSEPEEITARLGIEPLTKELNQNFLHKVLSSHSVTLKGFLLRQDLIAGLGNIYVDEVLWKARLSPFRKSNTLTGEEGGLLCRSIKSILRSAIRSRGTDFGDNVISDGRYTPKVYGREGKPCKRCGRGILKDKVAGRSTYYCACCQ